MKITAYEMEKSFKGSAARLWRQLPGEDVNDTQLLVGEENLRRKTPFPLATATVLHAVSRWSKNRRVYRFNPDLVKELQEMADSMEEDEELPADFLRLPFDAISIQLDSDEDLRILLEKGIPLDTSWGTDVSLIITSAEAGEIHDWPCLLAVMWVPLGSVSTVVLPIGKTVGESISAAVDFIHNGNHWIAKEIQRLMQRAAAQFPEAEYSDEYEISSLKLMIQMLLYLNASNADFSERDSVSARKERKKLEQKSRVKVTDVGYHVGRLLREKKSATFTGTGNRKRAHFRRAHWHHYWVGKRGNERKQILRWVNVMLIHPEEIDDKPTVMHVK